MPKRTQQLMAALIVASTALSAVAQANGSKPVIDPTQVYVESLSYNGSGCPKGTAVVDLAADRSSFTVLYDNFIAQAGTGFTYNDQRKNCTLAIRLHIPNGASFAVSGVDYRGFVHLDTGLTSLQKTIVWFQGQTNQTVTQAPFTGPVDDDYFQHYDVPTNTTSFSTCGAEQTINIDGQVRIDSTNPAGQGVMTVDTQDHTVRQTFYIAFKPCP